MEKITGKSGFLNKKGSIQDLGLIIAVMLFFGIMMLVGYKFVGELNTNIQANADIPTEAKTASTTLVGYYPGIMDNVALLLLIGMAIAAFVLAALVRVHPIFIPFYFIALTIIIFVSAAMSNVYQEMAATTQLATEATNLTFTTNILTYLPLIVGILGTILMVVMYKTWQADQF